MTSADLTFYTHPMSRGRIARWMLEEIGEPYDTELLGYGTTMKAADYLAINPMGKVPAIVHRGEVVTEAAAICFYLADTFPAAGLAPSLFDAKRAAYCRWFFYGAGPLEAAIVNTALEVEVPDERRGMVGYGSMKLVTDTLDTLLSNQPYFCGDDFTAADVYVGSQIGWGLQFKLLEPRPTFEAYVKRNAARPAAVRARQIDDALIAAQSAAEKT